MMLPQVNFKRILYATDLSESARYALAHAASIANACKAELVILHVMAENINIDKEIVTCIGHDKWEEIKKRNEIDARTALIGKRREHPALQEALAHFCENAKDNIGENDVKMDETIVEKGNPADVIVRVAEQRKCDLIVMGSYGISGLAEAIIGSTSRRVLKRTQIPVLVVRLQKED
ncbi:MAG: universal stress protein [Desulfobacterales bacterium]